MNDGLTLLKWVFTVIDILGIYPSCTRLFFALNVSGCLGAMMMFIRPLLLIIEVS